MLSKTDFILLGMVIMLSMALASVLFTLPSSPNEKKPVPELPSVPVSQITELNEIYQRLNASFGAPKTQTRNDPSTPGSAGPGQNTQETPPWRLVGIVNKDNSAYVLIQQDKKINQFRRGAALPDGSILNDIARDGMETVVGKEKRKIKLYRTKP